jgi:HD-like signal output (HDOD) protein
MKNILFVDDQVEVLDGLQNSLRKHRKKWKMYFAEGAEEALAKLKEHAFDVVVSDIRMPGMDGVALLSHVKEHYPNTVRIALSGHSELESTLKTIPVAQQFLAKPCNSDELDKVIGRACALQGLIAQEVIQERVGQIEHLPPIPKTYTRLSQLLDDPKVEAQALADVIEQDIAMSAKILQLVNSAFFASAMRITSIQFAVVRLGFQLVKDIVLAFELFGRHQGTIKIENFSLSALHAHAFLTGQLARLLFRGQKKLADEAFTAGILHDAGQLVLCTSFREKFESALQYSRSHNVSLHAAEKKLHGVTHAEIGGYLLGLWGLPLTIVEAVTHHHEPLRVPLESRETEVLDLGLAIHICSAIASEALLEHDKSIEFNCGGPEPGLVEEFGLESKIDLLRDKATQLASQIQGAL